MIYQYKENVLTDTENFLWPNSSSLILREIIVIIIIIIIFADP